MLFEVTNIILHISDCLLENIGKPVFHRHSNDLYGSWMRVITLCVSLVFCTTYNFTPIFILFEMVMQTSQSLFDLLLNSQDAVNHGDAALPNGWDKKYWVTKSIQNMTLYEYANKTVFGLDTPTKEYLLPLPFSGNDHVIYNRSFFYLNKESENIIRFKIPGGKSTSIQIRRNRVVRNSGNVC